MTKRTDGRLIIASIVILFSIFILSFIRELISLPVIQIINSLIISYFSTLIMLVCLVKIRKNDIGLLMLAVVALTEILRVILESQYASHLILANCAGVMLALLPAYVNDVRAQSRSPRRRRTDLTAYEKVKFGDNAQSPWKG